MRRPARGAALLLGAGLLAALLPAAPVRANGGTLRVADAPVGEYRVSVYSDPTPPRPDSVDVSVLVVREDDPRPVQGLDIRVTARHVGGPEGAPATEGGVRTVRERASREEADDPRYYAAKFAPGREGEWLVEVSVRGPAGEGTVSFSLDVRDPGLLDRPWVVLGLALLPLALLSVWLLGSGKGGAGSPPGGDEDGRGRRAADAATDSSAPGAER